MGSSNGTESGEQLCWVVPHSGATSGPWHQFAVRRYGCGVAATGVALATSLPSLLRTKMQSWNVLGLRVSLGRDRVSFGRQLADAKASEDSECTEMCFSITLRFGDHEEDGSSWFSDTGFCEPEEWLLQLHKAFLEPVPAAIPSSAEIVNGVSMPPGGFSGLPMPNQLWENSSAPCWPGVGRRMSEGDVQEDAAVPRSPDTASQSSPKVVQSIHDRGSRFFGASAKLGASSASSSSSVCPPAGYPSSDALDATAITNTSATDGETANAAEAVAVEEVEQQLTMFFSNADGHMGLLSLPVPPSQVASTSEVLSHWRQEGEVPFTRAGQRLVSQEDFVHLRENSIYMPDLLLLGLEPDLVSSLTPDWTWRKYPHGYGEVTPSLNVHRVWTTADDVEDPSVSSSSEVAAAIAASLEEQQASTAASSAA